MAAKIVVATDGSETGDHAVEFAASLAEKLGHDVIVVHVLMHGRPSKELARLAEIEGLMAPVAPDEAAEQILYASKFPSAAEELATAQAVAALGGHIADRAKRRAEGAGAQTVTTRVRAGDVADEVLDVAEAEEADLLVMGRRGLGLVSEVLLGSVSQKVLHHANCNVVIVR